MPEPDFIAVETLTALRPGGTMCEVVVRVGRPLMDDPRKGIYVCYVQCSGGGGDAGDEAGEEGPQRCPGQGPMQALHLALAWLHLQLEDRERSGLRFVWPESGEPFDWRQCWFVNGPSREPG